MLHPVLLLLAGFNPFVFRLVSLLLYTFCCIIVARGAENLGLSKNASIFGAVIFAILPSHSYQVTWIAEQGELLLAISLLLSFIYYHKAVLNNYSNKKYNLLALIFFIASILFKELAFAGILIPVINLTITEKIERKKLIKTLRDTGLGLTIVACILIYRSTVIGGSPFSSKHFSGTGPVNYIINFLIYIPLSFFPPEFLEWMLSAISNKLFIACLLVVVIFILIIVIYGIKRVNSKYNRTMAAGVLWFIIFILPGLPTLMRWYVFTASVGIIWVMALLIEGVYTSLGKRRAIYVFSILFIFLGVYDFSLMLKWQIVGGKVNIAVKSIYYNRSNLSNDSLYVFAVPDKINRIPMMKLGVQETVQWALSNKKIHVYSPVRAELAGRESTIELVENSDSAIVLELKGGRFMPPGGESKSVIKDEKIEFSEDGVFCRINTHLDSSNLPLSTARISLKGLSGKRNLWFYDGDVFRVINSI